MAPGEPPVFFLPDRAAWRDAATLIARHGDGANREAAALAARSRVNGNLQSFCHWRQIGRAIASWRVQDVTGTVH